jgi:hypothetical protein
LRRDEERMMARIRVRNVVESPRPALEVTLSERNLLVLLSKLYTPGSARTLVVAADIPSAFQEVLIRAEPDELHYADPVRGGRPPGRMHPVAEIACAALKDALGAADTRARGVDRESES